MRDELKKIKGYNRFSAILSKKISPSGMSNYILLNIKLYGKYKIITDHLWITDKNDIEVFKEFIINNNVKNNSLITFTAKKCQYYKGYYGNQIVIRKKTRDVGLTDYKNIRYEKGDENEKYIEEVFQDVNEDIKI